ncbi:rasGAP-activating-like protein 1 isoform X4 [Agelaius tricolor]|uniref:rasGAP-activating-like protein 1 isoform X4 n=1 Tax=Agelaius tricolor TaxID=9191 RepID=UPI0039F23A7D
MAKTAWLRCRVLEGKDLPAKDLSGSSNPYCVVKVDNEVVARTATVWKSLNPFWGEEITLLLPRGFHSLAIYVLDEDTIGQDDVIGKVSLSHQQISAEPRGIDSWLSLAPVSPDQEVQGEIHLELQVPERGHPRVLRCHLIEARDLAPRDASGTSDPFGRVSCCGHTLETAVVKKTRFPRWDEALEFELPEGELGEAVLSVELWDWDIVGKNDFLGRVEFFLDTLCPGPTRGWFHLLPFPSTTEDHGGQLGALRLAVRLLEDTVLPSHHYQPLIQLLTEPILCPAQNPKGTALAVLEEVTSGESRQDVATKLVKLFLGQGLAVPLLDYLTSRELARTTDPNTLFRSNSLASKSMEQFMKAVGLHYLHEVLKPVVNRIFEEKKYVELDPGKMELSRGRRISLKGSLSEVQVRESSLELLKGYLGDILDAIVGSVDKCPLPMRVAFQQLRRRVEQRFPLAQHEEVQYFSISGFLFLRFFAPAVLTPKLFGLREQHAEPGTGRTLLLLAKALQSIGNLGLQLGQGKEPWMAPLNAVLLPSVTRVRAFLDALVTVVGEVPVPQGHCQPSATIKEGPLHTCPELGVALLPRFAFKKRHFRLSTQALAYAKVPQGQVLGSIPVEQIRAVEQVDRGTFPHPHVLQVVAQDATGQLHTTYLQCKSALELWQWLWALRQATSANRDMLPTFHPGTFRASRWTCCLQPTRAVPECSRAHGAVVLGDWSDLGDPAVAAQSLYGHLRAALAGGPEGSAVAGPPCPGQAGGPDPTLGCSGTRWGQAAGGAARPGHRPRRLRPPRRDPRATPKSPPCPQRPPLGPARAGHRGDAGPAARHGVYSVTQRCTWHRLCAAPGAAAGDTGDTGGTGGTGDTGGTDAQRGHG